MEAQLRYACGVVFKRILSQVAYNQNHFWLSLELQSRDEIKNSLLQTLVTNDLNAKKAAADAIANICAIVD